MPELLAAQGGGGAALVTFTVYSLAVFSLAFFSHRLLKKRQFLSEYYLGSRGLGVIALTLSFGATSASAGSFIGFPAFVYAHGWVVGLWISSYMLVPLISMGLLGKRLNQMARQVGAITVPDLLRARFDSRALGLLATIIIIFLLSFYLIPQFKTAGLILDKLLEGVSLYENLKDYVPGAFENRGYVVCLVLFAILVIVYTAFGGFRAVVWTDVLQGFVMVFGVLFMLVMALFYVGGLSNVTRKMAEMTPPRLGEVVFVSSSEESEKIKVPARSWVMFDDPKTRSDRLLRVNFEAIVEPGTTHSKPVKVVEITGAPQIADITSGPGFQDGRPEPLPDGLALWILGKAVFRRDAAGPEISLPELSEFEAPTGKRRTVLRYRTVEKAELPAGEKESNPVKVYEVISPKGPAPPLPGEVAAEIKQVPELRPYAYGSESTGTYVTGPGPESTVAVGFMPLALAISFFFFWPIAGAGQPGNMVRLMAADSSKTLRRSIATLTLYYALIYFPLVVIFCCARVIVPGLEQDPDRIMPEMAFTLTEAARVPWLAGLLVAAPFAAAMSTVDSFMLMISSSVVRDVYQQNINPDASERRIKILGFVVTVIVGLVAMVGALDPPQFLQYLIVFAGGALAVAFLVPVGLALYWPRFNTAGAMASMIGGTASYLMLYFIGFVVTGQRKAYYLAGFDPFMWGLAVSVLAGVLWTLLTPPPPEELRRKFFTRPG